ncbi:AAA family ATPase [Streptomyces cyaneofuscatus]|uniref:AAA family ATPase n=1 Tax=Streptomyces cyaneofuscatus TaxID=66883 RepID=UPI003683EC47
MKSNTAAFFAETYGSDMPRITFISSPNRDARGSIIPDVIAQAKPKDFTVRRLLRQAEREGAELFFAPVPMSGEGMPSEAQAKDAAVIWADVDQDFTDEQWALIERLDATVNESGGVGRHHVFVPLDVPHPPHVIKELNQALRVALDGDAKQNPASFLRVPGSFNRKGEPVLCRTVRLSSSRQTLPSVRQALRTDASSASEYQRASVAVEDAVSAAETFRKYAGKTAPGLGGMSPRRLLDKANGRFAEGNYDGRHKLASGLTKDLLRIGLSQGEALGVLLECDAATDKWTPAQIAADVARVYSKEVPHQPDGGAESRGLSTSAGVSAEPGVTSADDGGDDVLTDAEDDMESAVSRMMAELLDSSAMDTQEDPEPLIDSWLFVDTVARIVGPPGSMKSFIAIDMSAHVGMGMPWRGNDVKKGPVIYLLAEGSKGAKKRKQAWEKHHRRRMENVLFLGRAIQVLGDEWDVFVEVCKRVKPVLVVLDTQSRITAGSDENSNDSTAFNRVDDIRKVTGACVFVVHHPPKDGKGGRGGSVWIGGLDTELWVEKKGKVATGDCIVTLENEKQKDEADGLKLQFSPKVIDLGVDEKGKRRTSVVLVNPDVGAIAASELSTIERVFRAIRDAQVPPTATEISKAVGIKNVRNYLGDLEKAGKIEAVGSPKRYKPA